MVLPFAPHSRSRSDRVGDALVRQVRDALTHLDDTAHLQTHPLAIWLPAMPGKQPAGAGRALRQQLLQGIEALRPSADTAPASHAWRGYQVLRLRYVDGLPLAALYDKLGISQSEYYRDHRRALASLSALLAEQRARPGEEGAPPSLRVVPRDTVQANDSLVHPPRARPSTLPLPVTSFVGRVREVAAVELLLQQARLVTLAGPPGAGKTRLAVQVARAAAGRFSAGVCFVALAEIGAASDVPAAIGRALGLEATPELGIVDSLRDWLGEQHLLLLLDNFEHVLGAARLVSDLLAVAPGLTVLTTSRAVLRAYGEQEYHVPPLTLPASTAAAAALAEPSAGPAQAEAVQLFLARARAIKPELAPSQEDIEVIATLCRRLDGLPLAIELAAARLRLLPPAELLARLDSRDGGVLPLLAGGARTLPSRQQALSAAIRWSYDLLNSAEQASFRGLAVFPGSFSVEAAEAVAAACTLDTLEALVAQSLLQPELRRDGTAAFRMLATLREFGLAQLEAAREAAETHRAFLAYYVRLADLSRREPSDAGRRRWLDRMEDDYANFRQALQQAADAEDAEHALRLANALSVLWNNRGSRAEGHHWLERVTALPGAAPPAERATALTRLSGLAFLASDPRAIGYAEAALALARDSGDPAVTAHALVRLGAAALGQGVTDEAATAAVFEEALALFRAADDRAGMAWTLYWQGRLALEHRQDATLSGILLDQSIALAREVSVTATISGALVAAARAAWQRGEADVAHRYHQEALALAAGSPQPLFYASYSFAQMAYRRGEYALAREWFTRCLNLQRGLMTQGCAETYRSLAAAETADHAYAEARQHFLESMRRWQRLGHDQGIRWTLDGLAALAAARGQAARAIQLAAAADTAPRARRWQATDNERAVLEAAQQSLGEAAAAAARAEGQALSLQQSVADVLKEESAHSAT